MSACAKCGNWHGTLDLCPPWKIGDRIEMVLMRDDPDPIPAGTRGTVTDCARVQLGPEDRYWQIGVKWDVGRSLQVCVPPDEVKVVGEDERKVPRRGGAR